MTTLNTALNFNFANSEAMRIASAQHGAEEAVAAQLRQAAATDQFKVGSTITARYQYKVNADGGLVPIETQITHETGADDPFTGKGRKQQRQQYTFNDLVRPRAELSPSDELALFADGNGVDGIDVPAANSPTSAEVYDDHGTPVEAELIAPQSSSLKAALGQFAAQVQFSVASLYARNNDVIYNMTPIAQLAA